MLQREEEEADPCAEALNNVQLAIARVSLKKAGSQHKAFPPKPTTQTVD
jgi:hypothetical protein